MAPIENPPELLAPAGNPEKLEIALHFGADAVYLGGKDFSLRNFSGNFSLDQIEWAVQYAHQRNARVYVACNVYARNPELPQLETYLQKLAAIGPDGLIVADPGIVRLASQSAPGIPLHLSTQANTTNVAGVLFWQQQGVKRVNAARELTLAEVAHLATQTDVEIEVFVHGAMCISYSGRCLLSSFMAQRHSNRGMCSHPCRWQYRVVEEKRPGRYMPLMEDDRGSYIFNAKDLCMIEHLPELIQTGVHSLKIEGRMKGIHYLATVVKSYREALNAAVVNPSSYSLQPQWLGELNKVNHRGYGTGFYFDDPEQTTPNYAVDAAPHAQIFVGKVVACDRGEYATVEIRNKLLRQDRIELLSPGKPVTGQPILELLDAEDRPANFVQPGTRAKLRLGTGAQPGDLIRKIDTAGRGDKSSPP